MQAHEATLRLAVVQASLVAGAVPASSPSFGARGQSFQAQQQRVVAQAALLPQPSAAPPGGLRRSPAATRQQPLLLPAAPAAAAAAGGPMLGSAQQLSFDAALAIQGGVASAEDRLFSDKGGLFGDAEFDE